MPPDGSVARLRRRGLAGATVYMATEYVAPGRRDAVSNWSIRIWSAPVP
jgi:hypothetical protein